MPLPTLSLHLAPTPAGLLDSRYPDGDDPGASGPTTPVLGAPAAISATRIDLPMQVVSTGGTAPLTYALQRSSTSALTGFADLASGDLFATDNSYSDTTVSASTQYWYRVKAVDAASLESNYSDVVSATTPAASGDTTAPTVPGLPSLTVLGSTSIQVDSTGSTDASGIFNYDVLLGHGDGAGNPLKDGVIVLTPSAFPAVILNLTPSQEYYVRLRARDDSANQNVSAYTSRVFATTSAGAATYLFQTDFQNEAVGAAGATAAWGVNTNGAASTIWIRNTTPLGTGQGNYFTGRIIKQADGSAYRSERRVLEATGARPEYNGASSLPYDMWYGFRWRCEQNVGGQGGYPMQFHDDPGGNNTNPCIAFVYNGTTLQMIASAPYNDAGVFGSNWYGTVGAVAVGTVVDLMLRIRWCYLSNAMGGNGAVDIYYNDETTPRIEYRGSTSHAPPYTSGRVPYPRFGGYWSIFRNNLTQGAGTWTVENSFDQIRIQGSGGSRTDVKPQGSRA